jgi:hypothetical protein
MRNTANPTDWFAADYLTDLVALVTEYEALPDGDEKTSLGFQIQARFEEVEIMRSLYTAFQYTF